MRRFVRRVSGLLLAAAVTAGVAELSRVPYAPAARSASLLRLSWVIRSQRVEDCRRVTAEELARQPIHMRRTEVCEGRVLPYHLRVEVDGRSVISDTVRAAGARGDRPIYVFQEVPLEPGRHRIHVQFVQAPTASAARGERHDEDDEDDDDEDDDDPDRSEARRLELTRSQVVRAGEVVLVTYDPNEDELVARLPAETIPQNSSDR